MVVFTLLAGYSPFQNKDRDKQFDNIKHGRYAFDERFWGTITGEAKNLVRGLLCVDPEQRLSATAARKHPWLKADTRALRRSSLELCMINLREFNSARKFKSAVHSVRVLCPTPRCLILHIIFSCNAKWSTASAGQVLFLNKLSLNDAQGDGVTNDGEESVTQVDGPTGAFNMRQKGDSIH